jgi:acyl-CoA reductase-like NAD-dependent aldehyde dehydrogenase
MSNYQLLIDGKLVDGAGRIDVINPADESVFVQSPVADLAQLELTVQAANNAFTSWKVRPINERRRMLSEIAEAIKDNANRIIPVLTAEQGKPLQAAAAEVSMAEQFCRHFAQQELPVQVLLEDQHQRVEIHRKPLGVVAGIMPWNFPFLIAVYKLAPALLAGNTIILKPAPSTPLTALLLGEIVRDIVPRGVINVITDNNDLGAALTEHTNIAKISFTGSTTTGKAIMASAAGTLKRLTLELGGNDAAIVLDDADPKAIAESIFGSAFLNSGQLCIALKRLYVHDSLYDQLCDQMTLLAKNAVVGDGSDCDTQFGPVQNKMQFDKVCGYISSAKKTGKIIAGGDIPEGPGYYVPITIVRDIEDGAPLVDEEPFGPILPIIKYSDLDDVITRANSSPFGLGGSVWSSDLARARQVAERIDSGTVWINQHCAFGPHIPFPASKESGVGVEWGKEGLEEFTCMQVININKE